MQNMALVEQSLTRAAEVVGDVTPAAIERFYSRFPEAKVAFEMHSRGNRSQLEGEMVERALYCLMNWFGSPGEVEILLSGSVLHHNDTLQVRPEWYGGLIDTTAEVIAQTIPVNQDAEHAAWQKLCRELSEVIELSRTLVRPRSKSSLVISE